MGSEHLGYLGEPEIHLVNHFPEMPYLPLKLGGGTRNMTKFVAALRNTIFCPKYGDTPDERGKYVRDVQVLCFPVAVTHIRVGLHEQAKGGLFWVAIW